MAKTKPILEPFFRWKVKGIARTAEGRLVGKAELIYIEFRDCPGSFPGGGNFYWCDRSGQFHKTPGAAFLGLDDQHAMAEYLHDRIINGRTVNQPRPTADVEAYRNARFDKAGNQLFWMGSNRRWVTIPTD